MAKSAGSSPQSTAIEKLAHKGVGTDKRVIKFREDLVLHDRFQYGLNQMAERTQFAEQQSITAVIGPTSSGKTALAREFAFQFSVALKNLPKDNQSTLLSMELAAPEAGGFKWRDDFYVPALEALKEPCATKKISVADLRARLADGDTSSIYGARPRRIVDYRADFYSALDRGKVIACLFDEANHMRRPTTKNGVFAQYDSLKSRSNACASHFILLGTTELTDIFRQSGAISKRVYPIWLSPYSQDEIKLFGAAVAAIVAKLPIKISFSFQSKLQELFRQCIGLVGLVHDWFDRVLVRALALGKDTISWKDMEAAALHPMQLAGIVRDVVEYIEISSKVSVYLKEQMAVLFSPSGAKTGSDGAAGKGRDGSRKPGERLPTRDPVAA